MYRLSLTSIPPRHKYLPRIVKNLLRQVYEVYVCIPKKYNKYPDPFQFPEPKDPRIKVVRTEVDYGPATKFLGCPRDGIESVIYVDDDTEYPDTLVSSLLKARKEDPEAVWGLSGFVIDEYRKNDIKNHHGKCVDVIEGFGGVIIPVKVLNEITEEIGSNDDIDLSRILERKGIKRKIVCYQDCHVGLVKQYDMGHHLHETTGGRENTLKLLDGFR